jgi:AraC-like DNA-binding protein
MNFGTKVLFFFSALGAFNGVMLSIYFFFFRSKRYLSDYLLGALLLVLSIRIGKSVAYFFDYGLPKVYLQLGLTACFFIGPFLYFYIKSEVFQVRKVPKSWIAQLVFWSVVIATVGAIFTYQDSPFLWRNYFISFIYLQWGIYIAFSITLLMPIFKKVVGRENLKPFEKWIMTICGAVVILFISYVWAILNITKGSYINGAIYFSIIIYLVFFVLLYRKKANDLSSLSTQKYVDKRMNIADNQMIIDKLKSVMTEKELYRKADLKVSDLASEIEISAHQLSQLLNDYFEKNFTAFVNEYRINEACKRLLSDGYSKIEAIGFEVGFNSRSTFFSAFKKLKGTTPAMFQQKHATHSLT